MVGFFTTWASSPQMAEPLFQSVSEAAARYPDALFRAVGDRQPGDAAPLRGGRGRALRGPVARRAIDRRGDALRRAAADARRCRCRRCRAICRRCRKGAIAEHEAKRILAAAGVPVLTELLATSAAEAAAAAAKVGERLVLKIVSPQITHKTEVGGVMLDVPAGEAGEAYERLVERVKARAPRGDDRWRPVVADGARRGRDDPRRAERSGVRPGRHARARRHLRRGIARRDLPHRAVRESRKRTG